MEEPRPLLIVDNLNGGGVQRVVVQLANCMIERGIHVGIIAEPGGVLAETLDSDARLFELRAGQPLSRPIANIRLIRNALRAGGYNIAHAHQRGVSVLSRVATIGTGATVVEHVHNVFPARRFDPVSFRSPNIVACGEYVGERLLRDHGVKPANLRVVRNAVPDRGFGIDPVLPSSLAAHITLGFVGRLEYQKDPIKFLDVVSTLARQGHPVRGLIIGDGSLRSAVDRHSVKLGLSSIIDIRGDVQDAVPLFQDMDLLMMTSRHEGLPRVGLEALAMGRGIIAPNIGPLRELVRTGHNGILYDPGSSSDSIVKSIGASLTPTVLARWGRASRECLETLGGEDYMIESLIEAYVAALSSRTA